MVQCRICSARSISGTSACKAAPMVRFGFPCHDGVMGERHLHDYLRHAGQKIGLYISEALTVKPDDRSFEGIDLSDRPGAWSPDHIGPLRAIADAFHKSGIVFTAQLALPGYTFREEGERDINRLTREELTRIRDAFLRAAGLVQKAGLDGVELHGAHTYFLNMMASSLANRRDDRFGGDTGGRLELAREIIEGIRSYAREGFLVGYRMGWTENEDTDIETAQTLERVGASLIHVSTGIPDERGFDVPDDFPYNACVWCGTRVKQHVSVPVICVNQIRTAARGSALIEQGLCDLVAYGRPFLADEKMLEKSERNPGYRACYECAECKWFTNGDECPAQMLIRSQR